MNEFGGSGIEQAVYDWICENLKEGKTIVELGAGYVSTKYLSQKYNLFSIENNETFCGVYNSTYIHAPLVNGWYDVDVIKQQLPKQYDLILIDGPTGEGNRMGFYNNLDLFDTNAILVFDDTQRKGEQYLVECVYPKIEREKEFLKFETFAVIK